MAGVGTPDGDLAATGDEEVDIFLGTGAASEVGVFAVDDGLTGEDIQVNGLEDMGCGVAPDGSDIRASADSGGGTDGEDVGLPLSDDYDGGGIGDRVVAEAHLATGASHTECPGVTRIAGEPERVAGVIEGGDMVASTHAGEVSDFEGQWEAIDQVVGHEVSRVGIEAIVTDEALSDVGAGKSLERET